MTRTRRKDSIPVVFISSTVEDLKAYRRAAQSVATSAGFHPIMFEHWTAQSLRRPVAECRNRVSGADLLVVITAHRYGWKPQPPDQQPSERKSITWLECEHALNEGKEVLPFLVQEDADWPDELRDDYRVTVALRQRKATSDLLVEVQEDLDWLPRFKGWLQSLSIRATFSNLDQFSGKLAIALRDWRDRHLEFAQHVEIAAAGINDPMKYLESLREETGWINIRGLLVGSGKAPHIPIDELYIPLTTAEPSAELRLGVPARQAAQKGAEKDLSPTGRERAVLEDTLCYRRLVITGDPGAGKTTFLYRIAFALSGALLERKAAAAAPLGSGPVGANRAAGTSFLTRLTDALRKTLAREAGAIGGGTQTGRPDEGPKDAERAFPIFIRIAELSEHIRKCAERGERDRPTTEDNPAWLVDFLGDQSAGQKWGLDKAFFERKLEDGSAVIMLDGLDEPPGRIERESMARLFEKATRAYLRCRFVVTTRPLAYVGETVLDGFEAAQIEPLEPEAIERFLEHWCHALFPDTPKQEDRHLAELAEALQSTPEIRRMARNPVMLTALAVVHWNERRLPEQRAELYRSILTWLARAREKRAGRLPAGTSLALLEHLALGMQDQPQGRLIQVSKGEAADKLAPQFPAEGEAERLRKAQDFITQEEVDSGIIVSRGSEIRFWHLTFQEYLAAKAISGLGDRNQYDLLLAGNKIYRQEWREVALLLAGVLGEQGKPKVDGLISAMLARFGENASLAERAKCVGLIGAMVRDLKPLGYKPADPHYATTVRSVLGIFDREKAPSVDSNVRLEAAEALGQVGDHRLHQDNWIPILAGKFLMGAQKQDPYKHNYDSRAREDESPVHEVYLDAYQIGRYPVTVAEYQRFVEDEGYGSQRWWRAGGFGDTKEPRGWDHQVLHPNRPVVNVSWYEAAAYCAWKGVRLPTEAEWEFAARGRGGRKYPWGNEEPDTDRANYNAGKVGHATPVGLYPRGTTPEGIDDLAGNVWEWVADWYGDGYYAKPPRANPKGPETGSVRVLRGGAWRLAPWFLRSSVRGRYIPVAWNVSSGFRCVRDVVP